MDDAPGIEEWLRDEARRKASEVRSMDKDAASITPFKSDTWKSAKKEGGQTVRCPSCGLTEGRHAYYCVVAYPDEEETETS